MDGRTSILTLIGYTPILCLVLFPPVARAQFGGGRESRPPLPENAKLKVFSLNYSTPGAMVDVLSGLSDEKSVTRMAIDQRTNSLIVTGEEKELAVIEALLSRLDQPGAGESKPRKAETLQLRIVWVQDGIQGNLAEEPYINSQVVDALRGLGFDVPVVVCQHFTTVALRKNTNDVRLQGQYKFELPVEERSALERSGISFQFGGQGSIIAESENQYALDFDFTVRPMESKTGSHLSGSIITPLSHYTVIGTTIVPGVASTKNSTNQPLSAFIVYLDKARTFEGVQAKAEKEKDTARGK
jgi:hypothetical protein